MSTHICGGPRNCESQALKLQSDTDGMIDSCETGSGEVWAEHAHDPRFSLRCINTKVNKLLEVMWDQMVSSLGWPGNSI